MSQRRQPQRSSRRLVAAEARTVGGRHRFRLIVVASLWPLLSKHFIHLWAMDRYRCLVFVPIAVVLIVSLRIGRDWDWDSALPWHWLAVKPTAATTATSQQWLAASWLLLTVAVLLGSPWISAVSGVVAVRAAFHQVGRKYGLSLMPAWLLLWLLIPVPLGADAALVNGLLRGLACWSGQLADFFGYSQLVVGHTIHTLNGDRVVAQDACQDLRLLFELIALTAVFVVWTERPRAHSGLLLLSAVFWGVAMAVVQLTLTVRDAFLASDTLATQWRDLINHLGPLVLGVLMLLSADRLLMFLLLPPPGMPQEPLAGTAAAPSASRAFAGLPAVVFRRWIVCGFAALIVVQLAARAIAWQPADKGGKARERRSAAFDATTLPSNSQGWERGRFTVPTPENAYSAEMASAVWNYERAGSQATVSCSFPCTAWRSPMRTYREQGWDVWRPLTNVSGGNPASEDVRYVALELRDRDLQPAVLLQSMVDGQGRVVRPPGLPGVSVSWWLRRLSERIRLRAADFGWHRQLLEVQGFLRGPAALDPAERQQGEAAFVQWRDAVAAAVKKQERESESFWNRRKRSERRCQGLPPRFSPFAPVQFFLARLKSRMACNASKTYSLSCLRVTARLTVL